MCLTRVKPIPYDSNVSEGRKASEQARGGPARSTTVRDADGFPVRVEQEGGDVFVSVAKTAPRGRMRFDPGTRDEFYTALGDADAAARTWEAAQAAGTEGDGVIFDTNVEMYCLAHRRRVRWLPAPAWWIHNDGRPSIGNPTDPRGCMAMWNDRAPRMSETAGAARVERESTLQLQLNRDLGTGPCTAIALRCVKIATWRPRGLGPGYKREAVSISFPGQAEYLANA